MNLIDYMYRKLYAHAKYNFSFEIIFLAVCNCALDVCWFSYIPSPSSPCFGFFLVYQHFKDLVQATSNANLQSLFYDVVSTINYFKEPLNIGVMDSQPPAQTNLLPFIIPSPLNGVAHAHNRGWHPSPFLPTTHCHPCRLCHHTSQGILWPMPSCTSLPLFPPFHLSVVAFGLPPQTNPLVSLVVGCIQSRSNLFQRHLIHCIEAFLCPTLKCEAIFFSNDIPFKFILLNSGSHQPLKCIMMGLCLDLGYSHGVEIFQNVEAM